MNLYGELLLKGENLKLKYRFNFLRGISRLCRIAAVRGDGLVKALLKLKKSNNANALLSALKRLGQRGSRKLQFLLLERNARWLGKSKLKSITLDADSPVKSVCGKQEGTDKGCNTTKQGAKSYRPLVVFISGMKHLYHTRFRAGSACTCEGIVEFLREVKVKLKNLEHLIGEQRICYDWRVKKQNQQSETWIEQVKGHTTAGGTPTDDFWSNDILLCVFYKSSREEFDRLIEAA